MDNELLLAGNVISKIFQLQPAMVCSGGTYSKFAPLQKIEFDVYSRPLARPFVSVEQRTKGSVSCSPKVMSQNKLPFRAK